MATRRPSARRTPKRSFSTKEPSFFALWCNALVRPSATFAQVLRRPHSLMDGALHIAAANLITAVILGIAGQPDIMQDMLFPGMSGPAAWASLIILALIRGVVGWLVLSVALFAISRAFGGTGGLHQQSFLIAIYAAPLSILSGLMTALGGAPASIFYVTPGVILAMLVNFFILLYWLYLLTVALRLVHRYSSTRAVMVWCILGTLILVVITGLAIAVVLSMISRGFMM